MTTDALTYSLKRFARMAKRASRLQGAMGEEISSAKYGIELRKYQDQILSLYERAMTNGEGGMFCIRSSRQTAKNEIAALGHHRFLERYYFSPYLRTLVRIAPTWKPQITNSKLRLEKFLKRNILPEVKGREGFIVESGNARIYFLSARANMEGATANALLDVDEAHKIDRQTFEEVMVPFTAESNSSTVLWGVGGFSQDILAEYRQHNIANGEPWRNLSFPAELWAEYSPAYRKHYDDRLRKLGEDHPVIRTQYKLEDLDATGRFFKERQIVNLMSGEHYRGGFKGRLHAMTVDIAGEQETEVDLTQEKSEGSRDSTVIIEFHVDIGDMLYGWPMVYITNINWYCGKNYAETNGVEGQQEIIVRRAHELTAGEIVVDARGIGNQCAKFVARNYGCVEYNATSESCNEDVFDLLSMMNNDRIKMWTKDDSDEWDEMIRQLRYCDYSVSANGNMNLRKPKGSVHIDFVKALSYIPRCVKSMQGISLGVMAGRDPL